MGKSSTDILRLSSIRKDVIGAESGIFAISLTANCPRNESNTWRITMPLRDYPIGSFFGIDWQRRLPPLGGRITRLRFYSSIWTDSKTLTTHWGTRSATSSYKRLQHGSRNGDVSRTPLPVWVAMSS